MMVMRSRRLILIATDDGLHVLDGDTATSIDDLAGREVLALAWHDRAAYALVDGREVWRSVDMLGWSRVAAVPKRRAPCLATSPGGRLVWTEGGRRRGRARTRAVPR